MAAKVYCLLIGPQCSKKFRKVLRSLILPRYDRKGHQIETKMTGHTIRFCLGMAAGDEIIIHES
jgi:hypothetical protein